MSQSKPSRKKVNNPKHNTFVLVWIALITQFGLLGSTWIAHYLKQEKTKEVAIKTEEVARVLKEDSKEKGKKLDEIHVLVNSRLTQALSKIQNLEDKLGIPRSGEELPK